MKDAILIELARRWKQDANPPTCENGAPDTVETARIKGVRQGHREMKRECADAILSLVEILGDKNEGDTAKATQ